MEKPVITFDKLKGKETQNFETLCFVRNDMLISKNSVELNACYDITIEGNKQTGVSYTTLKIPLWMLCRLMPPIKNWTYKIDIDVSDKAPPVISFLDKK